MQNPPEKEPLAGVRYLTSLLEHDSIVDTASLFAHGSVDVKNHKYCEEDYVAPPNNRIAEQVYPLIISRKELSLKM